MNNLVETHLRQARSLMLAGEPEKAVALLEKARALAAREPQVLVAVLKDLSTACKLAGRLDDSSNYFMELQDLAPTAGVGQVRHPRITKSLARRLMPAWIGVACLVVALGSGLTWRFARSVASTANNLPNTSGNPSTNIPTGASASEKLMYSDVGLVVVMAEYAGTINGNRLKLDWPIGSGSCFAFDSRGHLLTNRHVVDSSPPATFPNCPDMAYIRTYYLVCFGPTAADRLLATPLTVDSRIDMAVLQVDRTFDHPLELANDTPHAMEPVCAEGYPGDVTDLLKQTNFNNDRWNAEVQAAASTGQLSGLDYVFVSDAFIPHANMGNVSAPQITLSDVAYVEFSGTIAHGNSGGPLLNSHNQVVGMVTETLGESDQKGLGRNYAISVAELRKELELFIKQK